MKSERIAWILWGLLAAIAVFVPLGDDYTSYLSSLRSNGYFEKPYILLWYACGDHYLLWRAAIWIPATAAFAAAFRLIGLRGSYPPLMLLVFVAVPFCEWRQTLPLGLMTLAMVFLCRRRNPRSAALALLLLVCAVFLHHSMMLLICVIPFLFIPLSRRRLTVGIIAVATVLTATGLISDNLDAIHSFISHIAPDRTSGQTYVYFFGNNSDTTFHLTPGGILLIISRLPVAAFCMLLIRRVWMYPGRQYAPGIMWTFIMLSIAMIWIVLHVDLHLYSRFLYLAMGGMAYVAARDLGSSARSNISNADAGYIKILKIIAAAQTAVTVLYTIPVIAIHQHL